MNTTNKMKLSHVLYRVKDLHAAVQKLEEAGFIVEYGTSPEKAYNALIWFEEGVFIEIYQNSGLSIIVKWIMKVLGYQPVLDRMMIWDYIGECWCEWSLETENHSLKVQRDFYKERKIPFKFHKAKRKDRRGQVLRWELLMPHDLNFPFLMSAYSPNPRPNRIEHPNGIKAVSKVIVGKENLDTDLLQELLSDKTELQLEESKQGLQTIEFADSNLKIENILQ